MLPPLRLFGQMKRNQMLIAEMLQFMAKALAKLPLGVRHNGDNGHIVLTLNQSPRVGEPSERVRKSVRDMYGGTPTAFCSIV